MIMMSALNWSTSSRTLQFRWKYSSSLGRILSWIWGTQPRSSARAPCQKYTKRQLYGSSENCFHVSPLPLFKTLTTSSSKHAKSYLISITSYAGNLNHLFVTLMRPWLESLVKNRILLKGLSIPRDLSEQSRTWLLEVKVSTKKRT